MSSVPSSPNFLDHILDVFWLGIDGFTNVAMRLLGHKIHNILLSSPLTNLSIINLENVTIFPSLLFSMCNMKKQTT